jgi:GNAT superfamily N-acetyltransferase
MDKWDEELKSAMFIFNEALGYQREGVPMEEAEFIKLVSDIKPIIDPKLIFFAEVENAPIGLYVALPNINQVLIRLNGRLFPFGWLKLSHASKYITMASTKILGVLKEYRNKGIDALFYMKIAEELMSRGHEWVDYSLIAEENRMANRLVQRLGGKIYKICRTYQLLL